MTDWTEYDGIAKSIILYFSWVTCLHKEYAWNFATHDSIVWLATDNGLYFTIDGGAN